MVDADFKEPEEGESQEKKGGLKTIIIIAVIAVIMGVGGFFAGKMLSGGGEEKKDQVVQAEGEKSNENKSENKSNASTEDNKTSESKIDGNKKDGQGTPEKGKSGFLALDTFTVNLNDPFGRRYVECVLNLVLNDRGLVPKIKENQLVMAKMRHEIFMTISAKSYNELKSTAGKITLFEEVQMRVNEILKEQMGIEPVVEVLQTKFLMQ